nr:RNA-directed DNA polymerase, eukaryota [Tanacetum cinerariifolium]
MASGSVPSSTSKSKSEKSPGDGVKSYDFLADTKWWLHLQLTDSSTFWEPSWETINIEEYANIRELEAAVSDDSQKMPQVSENPEKIFSEMDPRLTGINKTDPWWRTADSNAMTSFVSDEHINNSDPPRPQINISRERFVSDKGLASLEQVSKLTDSIARSPASTGMSGPQSPRGLDNPLSGTTSNEVDNLQELSKAQLLEALCHSQTRAREAEKAAQQAYNEKEHILFRGSPPKTNNQKGFDIGLQKLNLTRQVTKEVVARLVASVVAVVVVVTVVAMMVVVGLCKPMGFNVIMLFCISSGKKNFVAICLDRHLSDHCPILLREVHMDFGPIPFRFYHYWSDFVGFDDMIKLSWESLQYSNIDGMTCFKKKLQDLK